LRLSWLHRLGRKYSGKYYRVCIFHESIAMIKISPRGIECGIARNKLMESLGSVSPEIFRSVYHRAQYWMYRRGLLWIDEKKIDGQQFLIMRFVPPQYHRFWLGPKV